MLKLFLGIALDPYIGEGLWRPSTDHAPSALRAWDLRSLDCLQLLPSAKFFARGHANLRILEHLDCKKGLHTYPALLLISNLHFGGNCPFLSANDALMYRSVRAIA